MTQFLRVAASQPLRFQEKYMAAENEASQFREIEWNAAVKIQSWWRGLKTRRAVEKWAHAALMIQKVFRGLKDRQKYDFMVKTKLHDKRVKQFGELATKIQALWRGYITRKKVLDFYGRKAYLEEVHAHNEAIRREMEAFEEEQEQIKQQIQTEKKKKKQLRQLEKQHHLLSTTAQSGVIAKQYGEDAEVTVRAVTRLRNLQKTMHQKYSPKKKHPTLESTMRRRPDTTPQPQKLQGPFLEPLKLEKMKNKLSKTSRARMDSYEDPKTAEDIFVRKDVGEKVFKPFANTSDLQPKKEPSIFMSSNYIGFGPSDERMEYGRKTFREDGSGKDKLAFSTTVRGTASFDDLNEQATIIQENNKLSN